MAQNAYLKIVGKKTGEVKGSVTVRGQEGKILVIAADHEVLSPRDPVSGLPTGKRMHKPFVITKETDKSSPLLYNMLCTNEVITEWTLQFFGTLPTGVQAQTHTVQLVNAVISDIVFTMPNNKHPDLASLVEYEDISFTYQKITWTWTDGGITASDDWSSPNI
jgi:type VI secretion system secreted protein Hcp